MIGRAEDQLNEVSFEDRQQLERSGATRRFFLSLTPAEQMAFLDATLPADFRQLMEAFNKMEPAKRKEFVSRALDEMRKHEGEEHPHGEFDEQAGQRIADQGLKAFYSTADADTKLDLAPLVEQMQRNLQMGGGPVVRHETRGVHPPRIARRAGNRRGALGGERAGVHAAHAGSAGGGVHG